MSIRYTALDGIDATMLTGFFEGWPRQPSPDEHFRMTRRYEDHRERRWSTKAVPEESYGKLLSAIIGFEIPVSRCEAKFKLGQNRSAEDRAGAIAGLERESSPTARELAKFLRSHGQGV